MYREWIEIYDSNELATLFKNDFYILSFIFNYFLFIF